MSSTLQACLPITWPRSTLDAAGLLALADLPTAAYRTALTGTSCLLDMFVLCPGLHKQQRAADLHKCEYPACAAMTSGYVFRVENPAMVFFMQRVGLTGHLTTLAVSPQNQPGSSWWRCGFIATFNVGATTSIPALTYGLAVVLTPLTMSFLFLRQECWALTFLLLLILVRAINVLVIRARATEGWKGAREKGNSDILILLSQDRWLRLKGAVNDVKAVTSGQWLRESTFIESSLVTGATLLVYFDVCLAANATLEGKVVLIALLVCSAALLETANEYNSSLTMYGRVVKVEGKPKLYARRLVMAEELIKETGRRDWAEGLGMVNADVRKGLPIM
ncbi:hypothetical protein LTR62_004678 [Meristemomyces frigidus]|uniref:Uncharacterized protein n=1 Tax=Meristemomyces frigidus TaxID=1508187 RepID=A0AAN7TG70_9PEZI|nr:hypothetical protein LTR62_004678 [Meristemomyces frigidus]